MSVLPLSDLTVVEVAESVAGAFCGRMLAAFGARVLKIERPPGGSWTRYAEPQLKGYDAPDAGALFLYDNMGKESVVLDWQSADGMAALLELVGCADVLIDDWQPRTRKSLSIDADTPTSPQSRAGQSVADTVRPDGTLRRLAFHSAGEPCAGRLPLFERR